MMSVNSATMFVIGAVLFAGLLTMVVFKTPDNAIKYFKTPQGKQALNGILMFLGAGLLTVLASAALADEEKHKWFAYGEVYLGVDQSYLASPQCVKKGIDNKLTSNGGLRVNVFQSADSKFEANTKYTHHSCAFGVDDKVYDAVGIEIVYRVW